jgi:predicted NodU family carbamoyl transferase
MRIFSISAPHPGAHDGCAAGLEEGRLVFSTEAEKDSGYRYAGLPESLVMRGLSRMGGLPDVLAQAGWDDDYHGLDPLPDTTFEFFKKVRVCRSTHERAHIFCTYGLSPLPQGQPCYVLVWEGALGCFYRVDESLHIEKLGTPIKYPGHRYQLLWVLANAGIGDWFGRPRRHQPEHVVEAVQRIQKTLAVTFDGPGKQMALSAFADSSSDHDPDVAALVETLMTVPIDSELLYRPQSRVPAILELLLRWEPFRHVGVQDQVFKNIAQRLTMRIYGAFYEFAEGHLREKLPLLIAGGCGLNCTWNTNWRECGLFPEVFVPPCTNDSGIAIGAGVDAQHRLTGNAKLEWSVMAGEEFVLDAALDKDPRFVREELDYRRLAFLLSRNALVGWVQGRYEMGPRALGHRSILAAPFESAMLTRLNRLKKRESYRPIAPICLEEDVSEHFQWRGPSPHMLYFQKLRSDRLGAVTHVDGTARVQTVNAAQDACMHRLLSEFRSQTGYGVLCNTSLNFRGKGFINRSSDLLAFAADEGLDVLVAGTDMLTRAGRHW